MLIRLISAVLLFSSVKTRASDLSYFPENYNSSVGTFKRLADKIKISSPSAVSGYIPVDSHVDNDLEVDYLNIPSQNASGDLLVITSGVHGAEAYTGSAIQQMFLNEILPHVDLRRMGVLLIHSLNPYGFKHFRRVDENNIDLNRNFPANESIYLMDNRGYNALSDLLAPQQKVYSSIIERLFMDLNLVTGLAFKKYSVKEIGDSVGQGQHKYPYGLEYGGASAVPQVAEIKRIVQKFSQSYRRVVFIDIHTGLGSGYQLHMMTGDGVAYSQTPLLKKLLPLNVDRDNYDLATGDDPGFYPTPGDIINYFPTILNPNQESLALTAEFGTIGTGALNQIRTLNRLILENQGFHYGYSNSELKRHVEVDFHELFLPTDPKWRQTVISKARYVLTKIVDRLGD